MEREATLVIPYFRPVQSQAAGIMSHPHCISTACYGPGVIQQKPPLSMGCWPSRCRNPLFALVREKAAATSLLPNPPYTRYTLPLTHCTHLHRKQLHNENYSKGVKYLLSSKSLPAGSFF